MDYKLDLDYLTVASKYISDANLSKQIKTNIDFVEKYVDRVDNMFDTEEEKHIAYQQLGSIAFSCVEALWKNLVWEVNNKCLKANCHEKCPYRKFETAKKLNNAKIKDIINHLHDMRLINIFSFEMTAIEELQSLRNYIHVTRCISEGDCSEKFNYQYVDNMLRLYYVALNQLELNNWFFEHENNCIKYLDQNGYEDTRKNRIADNKRYIATKVMYMVDELFYNKALSETDKNILRKLCSANNYDKNSLSEFLGRWLYYEQAHFHLENEYKKSVNSFYDKLKKYLQQAQSLVVGVEEVRRKYCTLYSK